MGTPFKLILLFGFTLVCNILLAQYNPIPDVRCYIPFSAESGRTYKVSEAGVIYRSIYLGSSTGTSGTSFKICKSINDNSSSYDVANGGGGTGCCYIGKMETVSDSILVYSTLSFGAFTANIQGNGASLLLLTGFSNNFSTTRHNIFSIHVMSTPSKPLILGKFINNVSSYDTLLYSNINRNTSTPNIIFINDSTGFIIGKDTSNNNLIIRSEDFGNSWSKVLNPVTLINDIKFSGDTGLLVGNSGVVYKSTDKGINWSLLPNFTNKNLKSLSNVGSLFYTAGDSASLFVSSNFGNTWASEPLTITSDIDWVKLTVNNQVYFQSNQTLYKKNYFASVKELKNDIGSLTIYPNPASNDITIQIDEKLKKKFLISIINSLGETVLESDKPEIKLSGISSGLYSVELKTTEGEIFRSKVVKID